MHVSNREMDSYTQAIDSVSLGAHIRDFHQLLGEHAAQLIATALHYKRHGRLALLEDAETLTDLHQEWVNKITRPNDPDEWKRAAKRAVRHQSHCTLQLIDAASENRAVHAHKTRVRAAAAMAADFHANIDTMAVASSNGDVHTLWDSYGIAMCACLEALVSKGQTSPWFYDRAARCIRVAQSLGGALDGLKFN